MNALRKASGVTTLTGFLLFILALPAAVAQPTGGPPLPAVRSWSVEGNLAVSRDTILAWLSLKPGTPFSLDAFDRDVDRIRSGYAARGFFELSIDSQTVSFSDESTQVDLGLAITEGRRAHLGELSIEGSTLFGVDELLGITGLAPGDPFSLSELERGMRSILRSYEDQGYPLARASVRDVTLAETEGGLVASVVVELNEGRRALVREVRVDGNDRTNDDVVVREVRLGQGRTFEPDLPEQVRKSLQRLDIFSSVSEPQFYVLGNGDLGLAVSVKEGKTNRFDGAVGYIPPTTQGRQGYVTGLIDVGFRNLFGTGRRLDARWRRIDRLSQDLGLYYKEPWLFGLPVSVAGSFAQRKQDSSYVQRSFGLRGELLITDEFSLGVDISTGSVLPGELATPTVSRSTWIGLALFVLYDSRDRTLAPRQGALYQTSYERGTKRIEAGPLGTQASTETKERITADVEAYFSLGRPHVLAVAAHGREVRTPSLDVSDLFRLGGARTLRGYAEDQFLGSRVVWTNLEYRLLAGGRSYLYGFFDWGYVATVSGSQSALPASEVRPYGYGAGLFVETLLGIVDVSIAAGEGDTFSTAKLHLRLVNEF